jgi:hypothetical protein
MQEGSVMMMLHAKLASTGSLASLRHLLASQIAITLTLQLAMQAAARALVDLLLLPQTAKQQQQKQTYQ